MADLSKVSEAVQKFVSNVKKEGGNKNKIDTRSEYNKLGQYLSGNGGMNAHERDFIEGFMIEYEVNEAKKKKEEYLKNLEEGMTDNAKDLIKDIKKRTGDKKKIDSDEEAQALATLLKNTKGDLNSSDLQFIKQLLFDSGYGSYLKPEQRDIIVLDRTVVIEVPVKDNRGEKTADDTNKEDATPPAKPDKEDTNVVPTPTPVKPKKPVKPTPDVPETPEQPVVPAEPEKTKINEADRQAGYGAADVVIREITSNYANNGDIDRALAKVNSTNAFSFIGKFLEQVGRNTGLNNEVFSLSDVFNKLTYKDTLNVMKALFEQATTVGVDPENHAYKNMSQEIIFVERLISGNPTVDPNKVQCKRADDAVKQLYEAMKNHIE